MRTSTMHLTENKLQLMSCCQCNNPWTAIKCIRESNQSLWRWGAERRKSPTSGRKKDAAASDFRLNKTRNYLPVIQRLQFMPCSQLSPEIVSHQEPEQYQNCWVFFWAQVLKSNPWTQLLQGSGAHLCKRFSPLYLKTTALHTQLCNFELMNSTHSVPSKMNLLQKMFGIQRILLLQN